MVSRQIQLVGVLGLLAAAVFLVFSSATANSPDGTADSVLGQGGSFTSATCNLGGVSQSSLCEPAGVALDASGNLYVADAVNNRVLEYDSPLTTGFVADRVFGQNNIFSGNACNAGGLDDSSLCGPTDVTIDSSGRLWISDHVNGRVLGYDNPLGSNLATIVIGQPNFTTSNCGATSSQVCSASGVAVDGAGNLYFADSANNRVLRFDKPVTTDTVADQVFGQTGSFTSNTCNLGGVDADSLCSGGYPDLDAAGNLYVADWGNHRVLEYNNPLTMGTTADRVFGQAGSFTSNVCPAPPTSSSLCNPNTIAFGPTGDLYVSDMKNSRVLRYSSPLTTDDIADQVFGQPNFMTGGCNTGGLGPGSLCAPTEYYLFGTAFDLAGNFYVGDEGNNRVLVFGAADDTDGDGCPDKNELQTAMGTELSGGRRSPANKYDYFNPTNDGLNRVDDIVAVVNRYYSSGNPAGPLNTIPPPEPAYHAKYDRVLMGPNAWNLGQGNGQILVDDILNAVKQYFHDCGTGIIKVPP